MSHDKQTFGAKTSCLLFSSPVLTVEASSPTIWTSMYGLESVGFNFLLRGTVMVTYNKA